MIDDPLSGLTIFLLVAEHRSFTRAAEALEVSPTAISKAVRQLELRHGVILFQRTTRSVVLTESGEALLRRLRPAAIEIGDALSALSGSRQRPAGVLRLTLSPMSMMLLVDPVIAEFRRAYPEVTLDLSLDEGAVDLASGRYDAGIRLGETVEKDMVAVRLTPDLKWCVVGSPAYFERSGLPEALDDLLRHQGLIYRFVASGQRHRWEFTRGDREVRFDMPGGIIVNDRPTLLRLARMGLGLAYVTEMEARNDLASGRLIAVLGEYITPGAGMFLYFPARTQSQPKLRAFIDVMRREHRAALG